MPFAVFVGVNHHGHSILLGCALLANELKDTYIWLFRTFLACMSDKAPIGIVTDQCGAICGAVSEVLPNTRHRLCLWHIMKKLPEKLIGVPHHTEVIYKIFLKFSITNVLYKFL
jgi:transposase-like protein